MAMVLGPFISNLLQAVIFAANTSANFKPQLNQLTATLRTITLINDDIVNQGRKLHRSEVECNMFKDKILKAKKLVERCSKVKRDFIKMFWYSLKLNEFNNQLVQFFNIEGQAILIRDNMQILVVVNDMKSTMDKMHGEWRDMKKRIDPIGNQGGSEILEREEYGWRVPRLPSGIMMFGEPLKKLKAAVLGGDGGDDYSVLVVVAPGGCGKTTLVNMLCHDAKIRESFGKNIFFVTVSKTLNFMEIVYDLFNPNSSGLQASFQSNEDAKDKLKNFFNKKISGPMLVVLDDVWSDSIIQEIFPSKNRGCRILVTSRTAFLGYKTFKLDPMNDEDAQTLFRHLAFDDSEREQGPNIDDNLVNQMVACCKRNPMALSVIGRSLNGKDKLTWESTLKDLSGSSSSVPNLHKDALTILEISFEALTDELVPNLHKDALTILEISFEALTDELKQRFLDFGLFPIDQKISVSALLNMWVQLYNDDEDGLETLAKIFELSYRCLVDIMDTGNDSGARVNYCDQQFVTQHDLLREFAIQLNSRLPLPQRSRLIINAQGEDLPASIENVQEPMQARILSISTGVPFSSRWCKMEVPNLEVLILNLMSETYTLPIFLAGNPKLKILNITNHGLYPTEFNNFHFLASSYNLTKIRLEHVSISPFILSLINLQKVSFIMCKIGNTFKELITNTRDIWPQLVEIEIDNCQDLVEFPGTLCSSVHLKKISITNCNEICGFNDEFGELTNLEMLSLRSCRKLKKLSESIWRLEKLSVVDISDCLRLSGLPEKIGKLGALRTIYMKGCIGIHVLPQSVKELSHVHVVCNAELASLWLEYGNVEIDLVEED